MSKIYQQINNRLFDGKVKSVLLQEFENASNWRDTEREFYKVIIGDVKISHFLKYVKSQKYNNFDEIYEVIKHLDIISQRKSKISKIEKHHNKK